MALRNQYVDVLDWISIRPQPVIIRRKGMLSSPPWLRTSRRAGLSIIAEQIIRRPAQPPRITALIFKTHRAKCRILYLRVIGGMTCLAWCQSIIPIGKTIWRILIW